ncbi:MAG: low affinity iron permease family protein [Gemmatimonadota bacterium]|nr:low affinity iron permease family protein [Gemmatimonadota bacterium]
MHQFFHRFAHASAAAVGAPWAFFVALTIIVAWGVTGPAFSYSDSWQLVINTGTTIVTFLMVFLIQNTQNREARVTQLKLDELIRAVKEARNRLVAMEEMSDEELARLEREFHQLHVEAGHARRRRRPEVTPDG